MGAENPAVQSGLLDYLFDNLHHDGKKCSNLMDEDFRKKSKSSPKGCCCYYHDRDSCLSSFVTRSIIGFTQSIAIKIPLSQPIGISSVTGMMIPKAIHMEKADNMKDRSTLRAIIGTASMRATASPNPGEKMRQNTQITCTALYFSLSNSST